MEPSAWQRVPSRGLTADASFPSGRGNCLSPSLGGRLCLSLLPVPPLAADTTNSSVMNAHHFHFVQGRLFQLHTCLLNGNEAPPQYAV